jgi:hypothetical protein
MMTVARSAIPETTKVHSSGMGKKTAQARIREGLGPAGEGFVGGDSDGVLLLPFVASGAIRPTTTHQPSTEPRPAPEG